MNVHSIKVDSTIGNWRNDVVKGAEYNKYDLYEDLFQREDRVRR